MVRLSDGPNVRLSAMAGRNPWTPSRDSDLPADGSLPKVNWDGAEYMARLIQVGTPNGGSLDGFRVLVDGRDFGTPIVPRYRPSILAACRTYAHRRLMLES